MGEFLKFRFIRIKHIFVRMNTKLTLSVDQDLIQKAKEYAKRRGTSISKMVEEYFLVLTSEKGSATKPNSDSPVDKLLGIVNEPDLDYDQIRLEALKKKYNL